jgi:hypothetical protein
MEKIISSTPYGDIIAIILVVTILAKAMWDAKKSGGDSASKLTQHALSLIKPYQEEIERLSVYKEKTEVRLEQIESRIEELETENKHLVNVVRRLSAQLVSLGYKPIVCINGAGDMIVSEED